MAIITKSCTASAMLICSRNQSDNKAGIQMKSVVIKVRLIHSGTSGHVVRTEQGHLPTRPTDHHHIPSYTTWVDAMQVNYRMHDLRMCKMSSSHFRFVATLWINDLPDFLMLTALHGSWKLRAVASLTKSIPLTLNLHAHHACATAAEVLFHANTQLENPQSKLVQWERSRAITTTDCDWCIDPSTCDVKMHPCKVLLPRDFHALDSGNQCFFVALAHRQ